ncbi:hypothetical protein SAMN06295879_1023 [Agreia bicolorata]|uniref:Uncharacterized protein n=1 Tax=Agreia bicolorata TaxID=110935 RepID=A0A1T4XDI0_9MICO|nr:hypothetical protein [Agreia bicolorata]SKA87051.1 hypothetical protein SAMN06295879_1023 [Agreia bicolorata]
MADWHPTQALEPAEWYLRPAKAEDPVAVIRRLSKRSRDGQSEEVWFRVVTWSPRSEDRELIGWCRTLQAAATAGWDYQNALRSWMHNVYAVPRNGPPPAKPPAADLLHFYREQKETPSRPT